MRHEMTAYDRDLRFRALVRQIAIEELGIDTIGANAINHDARQGHCRPAEIPWLYVPRGIVALHSLRKALIAGRARSML